MQAQSSSHANDTAAPHAALPPSATAPTCCGTITREAGYCRGFVPPVQAPPSHPFAELSHPWGRTQRRSLAPSPAWRFAEFRLELCSVVAANPGRFKGL